MTVAIGHNSGWERGRMYAIVFDLDVQALEATYGDPNWRNAYRDVRRALSDHGFDWQQGSTYFGGEKVDAISCVLAVQDITERFSWFAPSVRDIRMLRIEENNDLMPAVERIARSPAQTRSKSN